MLDKTSTQQETGNSNRDTKLLFSMNPSDTGTTQLQQQKGETNAGQINNTTRDRSSSL